MTFPQKNVTFNNPTPVSNTLKILIKTCIIPLKIIKSGKSTSVTFKLISKQTLIFLLYQWIFFGTALYLMFFMTGFMPVMTWLITKFYNSNFIDFVSFICIMMISFSIPTFCLLFFKQFTHVANEIILSPNLQLPNHWKKFVLFSLFYVISSYVYQYITVKYFKVDDDEGVDYSWWMIANFVQMTFINIYVFIFYFVVLCFIDEFKRIACLPIRNNIIFYTNKCIELFKSLQNGFGTTFLVTFSFYQIQNVFCTYMSISSLMSLSEGLWQNIVSSICFFTMSVYFMTLLYCITLTAEEAFDALQSLKTPLEKMLVHENDFTQREHIKATMRKLEKVRPLNGNGYFNITRETLTSIVSTTVTYLIILLQFR